MNVNVFQMTAVFVETIIQSNNKEATEFCPTSRLCGEFFSNPFHNNEM